MTRRAWAIIILVASAVLQGIAALAAWAIASTVVMAQRQEPGIAPGWTVCVVKLEGVAMIETLIVWLLIGYGCWLCAACFDSGEES